MKLSDFQLGMGTWKMGENQKPYQKEYEALSFALKNGITMLDTAEMYGNGNSELLIGDVLKSFPRESVFLVSKVYPHNASRSKMRTACENSLKRMGTTYLDLYLLHWPGDVPLEETVSAFEELKQEGLIRSWGVSNFDTADMKELWNVRGGSNCAANQVLYHVASRGVEYDLVPWMRENQVTLMAYCPLAHSDAYRRNITENPVLKQIAANHNASVYQIMLAFLFHQENTVALPKASSQKHIAENLESLKIKLTEEDLRKIDEAFPPPTTKTELDML